ncbi:MAG: hypothetical protein IJ958_04820 [Agathobacter sp.]|nr:hypothetical protein [Agathobacter sp.]
MMKYRTWMKRLCVLLIAGCMTLSSIPLSTYADPTDTEVDASEIFEIPEDAIYLSTPEDVLALAENCIDDVWSIGKFVVLNNDIDMTDVDFASMIQT